VSSRLLKLEKENRELQDSIEKLREEKNQLQGQLLSTQELERENQGLGKKVHTRQHTYTLPHAHKHIRTHTSI
jgi:TolA-binding protein